MLNTNKNPNADGNNNQNKKLNDTMKRLGLRTKNQNDAASQKDRGTKSVLSQQHFLKLMTTQLKNQDPFKPVDNTQMISQMAQFSSVAGIKKMSEQMEKMSESFRNNQLSKSTQMVGRRVLMKGKVAGRSGQSGYVEGGFKIPKEMEKAGVEQVRIVFTTAAGDVSHEMKLDTTKLGDKPKDGWYQYVWDGKVGKGKKDAERFYVSIYGKPRGGSEKRISDVASWNTVLGANITKDGNNNLNVDSVGERPLGDVIRVGATGRAVWQSNQIRQMESDALKRHKEKLKKAQEEWDKKIKESRPKKIKHKGDLKVGSKLEARLADGAKVPKGWDVQYQFKVGTKELKWDKENKYTIKKEDLGKQINVRIRLFKKNGKDTMYSKISEWSDNRGEVKKADAKDDKKKDDTKKDDKKKDDTKK